MNGKFENLINTLILNEKKGICIAFSGGIDSSLLLYLCKDLNVTAVTFQSVFQTEEEIRETINFCNKYKIRHKIIETFPLEDGIISNNPADRCYHCKKDFFKKLKQFAENNNLKYIFDGTNFDDIKTYRPGLKALKELKIISPFAEYEITKQEIRDYARTLGLKNYNKPSNPCIATRFPYNQKLNFKEIEMVKTGEKLLKRYDFPLCRLRLHKDVARIEIPNERFDDFLNQKDEIVNGLKKTGFKYVTLDLEGLRSSSMDIGLNK